jgi:hypothetical protein
MAIAVNEDDPDSGASEQKRGRGAGDPAADHDDVVLVHAADDRGVANRRSPSPRPRR